MSNDLEQTDATKASIVLKGLTVFVLLFAIVSVIRYLGQPLLEAHAFRQTQTALTSFWMMQSGWHLAYETPVAGYPWAIPFEFPLYQALAAAVATLSGVPLDRVGRFLSFLFLVGCAWPAMRIARRLALPERAVWVFCALLWSSPLYLFWGRSFMIETAALFFAFAAIPYAIDLLAPHPPWTAAIGLAAFGTAATLQKVTTGGPVVFILACLWLVGRLRRRTAQWFTIDELTKAFVGFGLPILAAAAWTLYADAVKAANPLGSQLTSAALRQWNFGSLEQRLSLSTYALIWNRVFVPNAGGLLGAALIAGAVIKPGARRIRGMVLAGLSLFVAPILIFTNLHVAHNYYQVSCVLFLIAALAVAITVWLPGMVRHDGAVSLMTCLLVVLNLWAFETGYGQAMRTPFQTEQNRTLAIAKVLRENTSPNSGFVAFGNDWSSALAYYAQRKSFTVPEFFVDYNGAWDDPAHFLGGAPLGAIVTCPSPNGPSIEQAEDRARSDPAWILSDVFGCGVLLRRSAVRPKMRSSAGAP